MLHYTQCKIITQDGDKMTKKLEDTSTVQLGTMILKAHAEIMRRMDENRVSREGILEQQTPDEDGLPPITRRWISSVQAEEIRDPGIRRFAALAIAYGRQCNEEGIEHSIRKVKL